MCRVFKESLTEQVIFEQRLEEGERKTLLIFGGRVFQAQGIETQTPSSRSVPGLFAW